MPSCKQCAVTEPLWQCFLCQQWYCQHHGQKHFDGNKAQERAFQDGVETERKRIIEWLREQARGGVLYPSDRIADLADELEEASASASSSEPEGS